MKKLLIVFLLLVLIITMAGCGSGAPTAEQQPGQPEDPPQNETAPDPGAGVADPGQPLDFTEGLVRDEYPDLVMTANVLVRKAFLPGMTVPVTVVIENKGDKSIYYVQGSGSFEIPEALILRSEDVQPVLTSDRLGFSTSDFVIEELKPGDRLLFRLNVRAILPNINFNEYTYEMFKEDVYIADMEWSDLQNRFPDLVAVTPGNYTASVYFLYIVVREGDNADIFDLNATGYAQADCDILIS